MKRILFYYKNYCGEKSHGGTEVATFRIAKALKATGKAEVFNVCRCRKGDSSEEIYSKVKILNNSNFVNGLADFIRENEIDVVVNMGGFFRHKKFMKAIEKSGRNASLLFMHHFAPGSECKKPTYASGWHLLKLDPANFKYWLRVSLYPMIRLPRRLMFRKMYRNVYNGADALVLLSEGYRDPYLDYAFSSRQKRPAGDKIVAIPNIYDAPSRTESSPKEKRVLVLSRMDEIQKRISLALKIWKKIEERDDLKDWKLDIVGNGHEFTGIKKLARKLGLERVEFHGWKEGIPFLKRSAILMSTSDYEGLPLSMIEAGVYECVPIAFHSYASLPDIIEDEKTGIIVENFGNTDDYAEKLALLMLDETKRKHMASNARAQAGRFSSQVIAHKWLETIAHLNKKN